MVSEEQIYTRIAIEIIAGVIMLIGVIGILYERYKTEKGIGVRVIQFVAVLLVLPAILILALEGILENQTTSTLIGTIVGYILSGIGKDEKTSSSKKS